MSDRNQTATSHASLQRQEISQYMDQHCGDSADILTLTGSYWHRPYIESRPLFWALLLSLLLLRRRHQCVVTTTNDCDVHGVREIDTKCRQIVVVILAERCSWLSLSQATALRLHCRKCNFVFFNSTNNDNKIVMQCNDLPSAVISATSGTGNWPGHGHPSQY